MCYDAVIFDNGGVLTKPMLLEVRWEAVRRAFNKFDVEPTTETVNGVINDGLTHLRRVCAVHGVPIDDFWSHCETHAAATQRVCLENGTRPLHGDAAAFDDIDHPLTVVNNDQHATVEHILDVFDIGDCLEVAYGRDPTVKGARVKRPDPHYIERTMGELGVDSAFYADDSNVGVAMADRAGIDSVFIHRPYCDGYQLAAESTRKLDLLDELFTMC